MARGRLRWSLGIFAVALGVRALHLWQIRSAPFFPLMIGDAEAYDAWAERIAGGDWLGEGVFYQAPLYPYFLAAIHTLVGREALVVRGAQAVLGALSCVLLAGAGWRLVSPAAGVLAGLLLALYAPAIFFDTLVQKSVLDLFLLCLALWLFGVLTERPRPLAWLSLGLALGALALTRENALVVVVPFLGYALAGRGGGGPGARAAPPARRLAAAGLLVAGMAAALLPVGVRNRVVGGEFHLTTSQLGPNLYIGNNERATGLYEPLRFEHGHARFERTDATEIAEEALGRTLSPAEVSAYWVERSLAWIAAHPARWLGLLARKAALTWNTVEIADSEDLYAWAEHSTPLRLAGRVAHFGILAPLALVGVWVTWGERRRLWPLHLLIAILAASVAVFFVSARYRFPLVPFLVLFAAAGVAGFGRFWREAAPGRRRTCLAAAVLGAAFCNWPLVSAADMRATTYNNVANALARAGDFDGAVAYYRRALDVDPDFALAHTNLGVILMHQGRHDEAATHWERALAIEPENPDAREQLRRLRASRAGGGD
jgi:pentatricopeptide repeat protein